MTILFLARLFYPHVGGVETHLLEISKRLVKKNKVIIITEKFDTSLSDYEILDGIEIHRISPGVDSWFKKFHIWKELWKYKNIFKKADIIHCHDVFYWYLPFRFLNPYKKVFTTFHGYETQVPPRKGAILIRKVSEKLSYGNICVGKFIEKWYGTRANFILYGGTKVRREESEKGNSENKIVLVGRLERDLGVPMYLEVLKKFKEDKTPFTFSVYGDGSLRKEVEKFGKVHGFITNVDKALEDADIVFASSYLSMLDSLVQKKLVIATFDNELKEDYLRMSPFKTYIIIENNPENITKKIIYFKTHKKEKEQFVTSGYDWAKAQTWENVVLIYEKLWHIK